MANAFGVGTMKTAIISSSDVAWLDLCGVWFEKPQDLGGTLVDSRTCTD